MIIAHREEKKGSEPAGLDIHGQTIDPDVIVSFDLYETFDIEFENSSSMSPLPCLAYLLLISFDRSNQLYPQMGRGNQGTAIAKAEPREDRGRVETDYLFREDGAGDLVIIWSDDLRHVQGQGNIWSFGWGHHV